MAVTEIAFTSYPAKDVRRLAEFYQKTVGLPLNDSMEEGGEMQYAEFKVGSGWFSVITEKWADVGPGGQASIVFEVDDIEKTLNDLKAKGVDAEDKIYDTPVCRIVSFKDPEGNSVALHQTTVAH